MLNRRMRTVSTIIQQSELEIKRRIPQTTGHTFEKLKKLNCGQQIIIIFKEYFTYNKHK
jgi:hypothetical protein